MNVAGYEIPNGPEDKPFLFIDPKTGPVIQYDIYDRSGHLYMLILKGAWSWLFPNQSDRKPEKLQ